MNKYKKFIKEAYKGKLGLDMCGDWKEKIETTFPEMFPEKRLELDNWFKDDRDQNWLFFFTKDGFAYGFNTLGDWTEIEETEYNPSKHGENRLATYAEIEEALIKEAKKRGVWDCPIIDVNGKKRDYKGDGFIFYHNQLWSRYGLVFKDGLWAKPLEETITKKEAEKQLGKTIID